MEQLTEAFHDGCYANIVSMVKQNQEQTCGNFSDLNDDMDDIKGRLSDIESKLDLILSVKRA